MSFNIELAAACLHWAATVIGYIVMVAGGTLAAGLALVAATHFTWKRVVQTGRLVEYFRWRRRQNLERQ